MPTCSLAWSHVPTCKDQSDPHAHKLPTCWIAHQPIPSASYIRILRLVADLPCPVISLRHLRLWRLTTSHLHLLDVKFTLQEGKTGAGDGLKDQRKHVKGEDGSCESPGENLEPPKNQSCTFGAKETIIAKNLFKSSFFS